MSDQSHSEPNYPALVAQIKAWARELGFADARISRATLPVEAEQRLSRWLEQGFHGEMDYMARHGLMRVRPAELVEGAVSVISVRMRYWSGRVDAAQQRLGDGEQAYISRYALGRDYHKVLRNRLQKLSERISAEIGPFGGRVFTDSAPVAEVALAAQSGQGWRGKHTLLLSKHEGSFFFLGELISNLPLPPDEEVTSHCGQCTKCIDVCPTGAIVEPYTVDARRCISYLTIELKTAIPVEFRKMIGNRVYGCDDCQLFCPWNRFAVPADEADFSVRHGLDQASLVSLFGWTEQEFSQRMAGSAIYRIGYHKWLSNLAVGLGNAPSTAEIVAALKARRDFPDQLVAEPVRWALQQHGIAD